jgi:predicted phosphodiesterase
VQSFGGTPFGFSTQSEKALRVRLSGLKPGRQQAYRVITEAMEAPEAREESEWREFRTLDGNARETRFAVWNDTHLNNQTITRLHAATPAADFLLWNGDICNDWHKEELLIPALLHPAGTDFTAQRPLAFVWGNHDLRGNYGFRLQDYVATPQGRSYFAFRSGPVAVVCLNTGEDKPDAHPSFKGRVSCEPLRQEQAAWLKTHVLATPELRDAPYRVVFCHIPLRWKDESESFNREYDYFSKRSRDLWHDNLVEWGAQVVVSGHTHQQHWMEPTKEFPYAQLIGGGPKPEVATFMTGEANAQRLRFTVHALDQTVLMEQEFKPIA